MSNDIYIKSYVYLFVMENEFAFKIGKSDNPQHRYTTLSTQYNFKDTYNLIECKNSKSAFELENLLHQTFSKFNVGVDTSKEFFDYSIYNNLCNLISNFTNHTLTSHQINKIKEPLYDVGLNKDNIIIFSNLIKTKRKELGYTQSELSNIIGCSRSTLQKIECDHSYNESFKLYILIADLLNIKLSFY